MINRDKIIEKLVDDDLNTILTYGDDNWILSNMLINGFKGYTNYTDDELIQEINEREIYAI